MERYGVNANIKQPLNVDEEAMKFLSSWDGQPLDPDDQGIVPPLFETDDEDSE